MTNLPKILAATRPMTLAGAPMGFLPWLAADLAHEMMPYTPERLIQIAEREYAWCEAEMKKASRAMGFGDDWRKAVEKVKNTYVEPGKQPDLIRDLAREAEDFVEKRELVTVPPMSSGSIDGGGVACCACPMMTIHEVSSAMAASRR